MKAITALGLGTLVGLVAFQCLPRETRHRWRAGVKRRMSAHMERMIAGLPEGAPPKLVMSILPRLQAQNDQIIALLKEQNELLRTPR